MLVIFSFVPSHFSAVPMVATIHGCPELELTDRWKTKLACSVQVLESKNTIQSVLIPHVKARIGGGSEK